MDFSVTNVAFACHRRHDKGYSLTVNDRHYHGLTLIVDGEFEMTINGSTVTAEPGSIILQRKGDSYRLMARRECGVEYVVISYSIETDGDLPAPFCERILRGEHTPRYLSAFDKVANIYASEGVCSKPYLRALVQEILCNIIRGAYSAPLNSEQDPVARAKKHIERYYSLDLTSESIAAEAGLSPSYLRTCFHRSVGDTPIHYLNRIRIERAKEMLASGEFSLTEVSEACGFKNVYYFNRVFKAYTGISPGRY